MKSNKVSTNNITSNIKELQRAVSVSVSIHTLKSLIMPVSSYADRVGTETATVYMLSRPPNTLWHLLI